MTFTVTIMPLFRGGGFRVEHVVDVRTMVHRTSRHYVLDVERPIPPPVIALIREHGGSLGLEPSTVRIPTANIRLTVEETPK